MSRAASSPRIAPARRRTRLLKVAAAGAAVVGFGVLSVIVRSGAHANGAGVTPTRATGGSLAVSSRISEEAAQSSGSFFGSGSVAPSQSSSSQPQSSTHTS